MMFFHCICPSWQTILLYVALGKVSTLQQLAKAHANKDPKRSLERLLQHDFRTARGRQVRCLVVCRT
jgi:hypothetical protein